MKLTIFTRNGLQNNTIYILGKDDIVDIDIDFEVERCTIRYKDNTFSGITFAGKNFLYRPLEDN